MRRESQVSLGLIMAWVAGAAVALTLFRAIDVPLVGSLVGVGVLGAAVLFDRAFGRAPIRDPAPRPGPHAPFLVGRALPGGRRLGSVDRPADATGDARS